MQENFSLDPFTPAIHLIYAPALLEPPTDRDLTANLVICEAVERPNQVEISRSFDSPTQFLGEVSFGLHKIQIAGLSNPLPSEILDRTVNVSPWQPQIRAAMRQHRSQPQPDLCRQPPGPGGENDRPSTRWLSPWKTRHLLGIVNEPAWTAHPPADFLSPDRNQHLP